MSKERSKKYRESLKLPENLDKLSKLKENKKNRSIEFLKKISSDPEQLADFKRRKALANARYKNAKRLNSSKVYSSKRSIRKAVKKTIKSLPDDPVKRIQVVQALSAKFLTDSEVNIATVTQENPSTSFNTDVVNCDINEKEKAVNEFYLRDDVSRTMPGMKNFKSVKNKDGVREKIQIRYMTMTLDNAYCDYKAEHPEDFVSRTKFFTLRPEFVVSAAKTPHDVCSCRYHQDMDLLFKSLSRYLTEIEIANLKELVINLVCSVDNYDCMSGKCCNCENFEAKLKSFVCDESLSTIVTYQQWVTTMTARRESFTATLGELLKIFIEKFSAYKLHSYITNAQQKSFQIKKATLNVRGCS
jgi:hypothetical protein